MAGIRAGGMVTFKAGQPNPTVLQFEVGEPNPTVLQFEEGEHNPTTGIKEKGFVSIWKEPLPEVEYPQKHPVTMQRGIWGKPKPTKLL